MRISINFYPALQKVSEGLDDIERNQIPFAVHQAINDTAFDVRRAEIGNMPRKIDRPSPSTKRSVVVKKSPNKQILYAEVGFTEWAQKYISMIVRGGIKRPRAEIGSKNLLFPVKGAPKRFIDRYGGWRRKWFAKGEDEKKASGGSGAKPVKRYFIGTPKGGNRGMGIWERHNANKKLRMIAQMRKSQRVKSIYPFYRIGVATAKRNFQKHFLKRFGDAMKTAKIRRIRR